MASRRGGDVTAAQEDGVGQLGSESRGHPTSDAAATAHASSSADPARLGSTTARDRQAQQSDPKKEVVGWLDLPNKDQLFILALCRLSEPLSNVCLLPYIFYLVRSVLAASHTARDGNDADNSHDVAAKVSTYSGLLVASFPLAQFFVSLPWGRFSDWHGRKSSIAIGMLVSVLANAAFGFSRSMGWLMFWRTLAGVANGNIGIMRTMTAEIVKERKYQTKAFLMLPLVFNSGMVVSLALGGLLAEPVANLPWLFGPQGAFNLARNPGGVQWAAEYPYALPALMNALVLSVALCLAVFGLRETLAGKENKRDVGLNAGQAVVRWFKAVVLRRREASYMKLDEVDVAWTEESIPLPLSKAAPVVSAQEMPLSTQVTVPGPRLRFSQIWTPPTIAAIVSFGLLPLHNAAFMHIFPVYLSTPHSANDNSSLVAFVGGLGLRSSTIGLWLSFFGICGILLQMFIYPRMQARLGTLGTFKIALVIFPAVYVFAPYLSVLPEEGPLRWLRWTALAVVVWGQIMARTIAIPSTVILLTEATPSKSVLGTVHGAGNMLSSLSRAIGPAVGGWVYAWGVREGVVGAVWWFYLVFVALTALIWCFGMQTENHEAGKPRQR